MASETDKSTAFAVVEWLQDAIKESKVSGDDKEGVETAVQIIEEAFSVSSADESQQKKHSLKPANLSQVLQIYQRTKAASSAPAAASAGPSSSAQQESSSEHATPRDKAAAEDLKAEGNTAMAGKNYDKAIDCYTQAIAKDAGNPVYYSNRAAAYSQVNKHEDAIADAKKASEVDPTFSKAYSRLGHALYCSGRYAEAAEAYENGLKHDPNNATMKSSLATAKSKAGALTGDEAGQDSGDAQSPRGGAGGAGGFPGMGGGGGGMPDLSSLMNNPQIMQMAQQMMGNGGMEQLMNNPMMRQMADNFRQGGQMPNMSELMNNPQLAQMASQMGLGGAGGGGGGGGAGGAGGRGGQ